MATIAIHLSERLAVRLEAAARDSGATSSMLIEAALGRFLGGGGSVNDIAAIGRSLAVLSHQLEQLNHDVAVVKETVALHARFHLTVAPALRAKSQAAACARGAARFEEFAGQVARRIERSAPLMQTTMERFYNTEPNASVSDEAASILADRNSATQQQDLRTSTTLDSASPIGAAGREDGSRNGFPARPAGSFHASCRRP